MRDYFEGVATGFVIGLLACAALFSALIYFWGGPQ